ncbi:hypothetical protein K438DRAFT_1749522 [Mycena galopus ATCC 62051]|nr:hypothetical protein K438DRAFT_1749522 [Mycena galopus ATCC 62051]
MSVLSPALQQKELEWLRTKKRGTAGPNPILGLFHLYLNGLTKPLPKRCIHRYVVDDDGAICLVTYLLFVLELLDDPGVNAFGADSTYKRIEVATVVRVYINRANNDFFEKVLDKLQRIKLMVTWRPILLKRFVRGSNRQRHPKGHAAEQVTLDFVKVCWRHGKE